MGTVGVSPARQGHAVDVTTSNMMNDSESYWRYRPKEKKERLTH